MEILKGIRDWKENNEGTFRGEINIIVGLTRQEEEQNWVNKITSQEGTYVDDVTGEVLPTELVRNARKEELDYFHKRPMYSKVPLKECVEETGKSPIKVRWVDHNKRTQEDPDIRSRLVAMEFNKGPMEGVFAAMPPIEAKRLLFSLFTTLREQGSEEYVLNFLDAKKADCHARPRRQLYVELPPEDASPGMCAKLHWCMYGTRDAAAAWEDTYTKILVEAGFKTGRASNSTFWHPARRSGKWSMGITSQSWVRGIRCIG